MLSNNLLGLDLKAGLESNVDLNLRLLSSLSKTIQLCIELFAEMCEGKAKAFHVSG